MARVFARWGSFVVRARWTIIALGLVIVALGATWGSGVFAHLSSGGFLDTGSQSQQVRERITAAFGPQDADIFVLYSSPSAPVTDPAFASAVRAALTAGAARTPQVDRVVDYYTTGSPQLVSADGHETYAVVYLREGTDDQKLTDYQAVKSSFVAGGGVTTRFGGLRSFYDDANAQTKKDIEQAETFSLPILLVLLVLIFGSVVAALAPLVVGGLAILGGFIVVRIIAQTATVSTFAVNVITLIGLGLSIDYALFVVSRFREEMARGATPRDAVVTTMATAGRTVAVSGLTVTLALAGLLIFPQVFLRSMGYGAMSAVLVAMLASLTVLPAALSLLGDRINAWRIPLPWLRRAAARQAAQTEPGATGAWARLATSVMRRPWLYVVGVLIVLGVLAWPIGNIKFGGIDDRSLPASAPSRVVGDAIARDFPPVEANPVQVFVGNAGLAQVCQVLAEIEAVPHVTSATLSQATAPISSGDAACPAAADTTARGDALITVSYHGEPTDAAPRQIVAGIRGLAPPAGATIGVTGATADLVDQLSGLGSRLPWMALLVIVVTCVLLFFAFGSVVLPVKAVLMNIVSLGAAFGAVVFIFQEGHGSSLLGFTATGVIDPTNPILMIAVLFGLATDYEVFLLSRIREEWDGRDPAEDASTANRRSVATGLQRTGRIITSAALLLVIVVVGFASGQIAFVKLIGVGMIVAIVVDATLVRALLVPATMRLLGRWNWWAPGPLARVYRRYGLRES